MGVWCIVVLCVIVGASAKEHPPANPPYLLEEVKATAESRVLERVEVLLQALDAKIKVLDDGLDELKNYSISATQRMTNLENKLERLQEDKLADRVDELKRDIINLDNKLERPPRGKGVYLLQPEAFNNKTFEVLRDWTASHTFGGDWIVFQRRFNGSVDFYRNWTEYKNGFGDVRGEHWLGLDKLHEIITSRRHELLIVLEDFEGVTKYAHYDDFKIGDESEKYILKSFGTYTGTVGDALTHHTGCVFSTYDQDNDQQDDNCSEKYKGAWWFGVDGFCLICHLNGEYLKGRTDRYEAGINWYLFGGDYYSLKSSRMMVRPAS